MTADAEYTARLAHDAGFKRAEIVPTSGHPGVFATLDAGARRTMGIYFMYDVKQHDAAEWSSPPLEARIVDKPGFVRGIVGRGAVNQKGPQAAFPGALEGFRAGGRKFAVNIVLVAESEEEIGSPHFTKIARRPVVHAALQECEGAIIPSGWHARDGSASVNLGAKGIVELEFVSSGAKRGRGPVKRHPFQLQAQVGSPSWRLVLR